MKTSSSLLSLKFKLFSLQSQHLVQSPDNIDPAQLSCFNSINVTDFDLLDQEVSAAKSITLSILAKGFPEGWLDETITFPEEFDLNAEFDLAAEFNLEDTALILMMKEATDDVR